MIDFSKRYTCADAAKVFKNGTGSYIPIIVSHCLPNKLWSVTSVDTCVGKWAINLDQPNFKEIHKYIIDNS